MNKLCLSLCFGNTELSTSDPILGLLSLFLFKFLFSFFLTVCFKVFIGFGTTLLLLYVLSFWS